MKYHSMDATSGGNMVVGGSTKNTPFFQSSSSNEFPFFEYYDSSNCAFRWSVYLNKELDSETVTVKFSTDFS